MEINDIQYGISQTLANPSQYITKQNAKLKWRQQDSRRVDRMTTAIDSGNHRDGNTGIEPRFKA